MQTNRQSTIERMWNRASIKNQGQLIQRFIKHHGRNNVQQSAWMNFLAEEFEIGDSPSLSRHISPS